MQLEILMEFAVPVVVGICLCVGYIIKHLSPGETVCRFIPLLMGGLGIALNAWLHLAVTPEILLGGLFSGLASTGLHQAFHQMIGKAE